MKKISSLTLCLCALLLALTSVALNTSTSSADRNKPNWFLGEPEHAEGAVLDAGEDCKVEETKVVGLPYHIYVSNPPSYDASLAHLSTTHHDTCVYHAKNYSYTKYTRWYYADPTSPMSGTFSESGIAMSHDGEDDFRPVQGLETDQGQFLGKDSNAFIQHGSTSQGLQYYNDLRGHVTQLTNGTLVLDNQPDYVYKDASGGAPNIQGLGVSPNKRWLSFGVANFGIISVDTHTFQTNRVSDRYDIQGWTWPFPMLNTTISDDGAYIVVGGMGYQTEIINAVNCGSPRLADGYAYHSQLLGTLSCEYRDLTTLTWSNSQPTGSGGYRVLNQLRISASGALFTYWDNYKWNTIYAPNYLKPGQLYYLALGDSYAAGEGDVTLDGADHYLPGTNIYGDYRNGIPRETCHISTRSYPMRIAEAMQLTRGSDMRSIACSGAVTGDVLSSDLKSAGYVNSSYLGQGTQHLVNGAPRLAGLSNTAQLQVDARSNYIPGRVQQIELMKKAQPLYATIMMGGNDLGFGDVLTSCATNTYPTGDETCDYAHGEGFAGQAQRIHDFYPKLLDFYKDLKEVSPRTTIYVIGYPQFMDASGESCPEMLDLYTKTERQAIHSLISYANGVIHNAALDAGAKYIDVSDALTGKQLCGSGTGMTGFTDLLLTMIYTEYMKSLTMADSKIAKYADILPTGELHKAALKMYVAERAAALLEDILYSPITAWVDTWQELSHPNAIGHEAIFNIIRDGLGEDLLDSTACNQIVSCPGGAILGQPNIARYMPGLSLKNDTVYIRGKGKVTVGRKDSSGKVIVGALALAQSLTQQFIRVAAGVVDGTVDPSKPVTVEIHSQPIVLGEMTRVGDDYELITSLSQGVSVGQHVLHIKGTLMDGRFFDIDSPVFVEGPAGDIDGDGIADSIDSCAFGAPSGIDTDLDGIDDSCDLNVQAGDVSGNQGAKLESRELTKTDTLDNGSSIFASPASESPLGIVSTSEGAQQSANDSEESSDGLYAVAIALFAILISCSYAIVRSRRR